MPVGTMAIIDGHYYAYRFHFGLPAVRNAAGQPIGVLVAFAELFRQLRRDGRISHWALVFDHPGPSFRHEIYPPYKSHRPPMPEELALQLPWLQELAAASAVPVLVRPGLEADDVIASLARQAASAGLQAWICSRDKDLDQLLDERIHTWDPLRDQLRGPHELFVERGLSPAQVVDYLCMVGDSADNVPGIRGVGPKSALRLLKEHGDLEGLLAAAGMLSGKRRKHVLDFRERAPLTRRLITLVQADDLPESGQLRQTPELPDEADPVYRRHGLLPARFRSGPGGAAHAAITAIVDPGALPTGPGPWALAWDTDPAVALLAGHPDPAQAVPSLYRCDLSPPMLAALATWASSCQLVVHDLAASPLAGRCSTAFDVVLAARLVDERAGTDLAGICDHLGIAHQPPGPTTRQDPSALLRLHTVLSERLSALQLDGTYRDLHALLHASPEPQPPPRLDGPLLAETLGDLAAYRDGLRQRLGRRAATLVAELAVGPACGLADGPGEDEDRLHALAAGADEDRALAAQVLLLDRILGHRARAWTGTPLRPVLVQAGQERIACGPRFAELLDHSHPARSLLRCWRAAPRSRLVLIDARHLPLALLAEASGDPALQTLCRGPADQLGRGLAEALGVDGGPAGDRLALQVVQGLLDGLSAFAIGRRAGVDRESVQVLIDAFEQAFILTARCLHQAAHTRSQSHRPSGSQPQDGPAGRSPLTTRAIQDRRRSLTAAFRGSAHSWINRLFRHCASADVMTASPCLLDGLCLVLSTADDDDATDRIADLCRSLGSLDHGHQLRSGPDLLHLA